MCPMIIIKCVSNLILLKRVIWIIMQISGYPCLTEFLYEFVNSINSPFPLVTLCMLAMPFVGQW